LFIFILNDPNLSALLATISILASLSNSFSAFSIMTPFAAFKFAMISPLFVVKGFVS